MRSFKLISIYFRLFLLVYFFTISCAETTSESSRHYSTEEAENAINESIESERYSNFSTADDNSANEILSDEASNLSNQKKPNILLILLDDLDVHTYKQLLNTNSIPTIKSLSASSTNFTNAFVVEPQCCPSRASILTGQYPHNHGVKHVIGEEGGFQAFHGGAKKDRSTIAQDLKKLNYYTGVIGKYLSGAGSAQKAALPLSSWDVWNVVSKHNQAPLTNVMKVFPGDSDKNNLETIAVDKYLAKYMEERTIKFLDNWKSLQSTSSSDKPFFLYLTPPIPHVAEQRIDITNNFEDGLSNRYSNTGTSDFAEYTINNTTYPGDAPNSLDFQHPQFIRRVHLDIPSLYGSRGYSSAEYQSLMSNRCSSPIECFRYDEFSPKPGFSNPAEVLGNFNRPGSNKPKWIDQNFVDLEKVGQDVATVNGATRVLRGTTYKHSAKKYLQRQHLDRLGSMLSVDLMLKNILSKLDRMDPNLRDNTIVIFASDNGFLMGQHRVGNKVAPYIDSIQIPLFIKNVGQRSAKTVTKVALNIDIAPTILDLVGGNWQTPLPRQMDGRSLKPILISGDSGVSTNKWRQWFLVENWLPKPAQSGIPYIASNRTSNWWLVPDYHAAYVDNHLGKFSHIKYDQTAWNNWKGNLNLAYPLDELYNLSNDRIQINNLINSPSHQAIKSIGPWITSGLKDCRGASCRKRETPAVQYDISTVSRYKNNNLCGTDITCNIESREVFDISEAGIINRYEVIATTLNFAIFKNGILVTASKKPLRDSAIGHSCSDLNSCTIDSIAYTDDIDMLSVSSNNKYWNFSFSQIRAASGKVNAISSGDLLSISRYRDGPCRLDSDDTKCTFEARSVTSLIESGIRYRLESIYAYGHYWNYKINPQSGVFTPFYGTVQDSNGFYIGLPTKSVARYAASFCSSVLYNATLCSVKSRSVLKSVNGETTESITSSSGKYLNYVNGYNNEE